MPVPERLISDIDEILQLCESRIGYRFSDRKLLRRCLTHSSSAETRLDSNERLEFLGDAVLGLVICEYLFLTYPDEREGQLTQMKSQLVSRTTCARVARKLALHELILVGRGLSHMPESILSALVESLIAGIYLDGEFPQARQFILRAFAEELSLCRPQETDNYKSQLQEQTQRFHSMTPDYLVVEERGPDHAREFCIAARIGAETYAAAWGRSKKEAEQQAARMALEAISATAKPTADDSVSVASTAETDTDTGAGSADDLNLSAESTQAAESA
jgi:ribonuclease III